MIAQHKNLYSPQFVGKLANNTSTPLNPSPLNSSKMPTMLSLSGLKCETISHQEEPVDTTRFVVQQEGNQIAFIHWGRAINKYGSTQFNGRERGFDRDLEKMLILSASDKSESTETVTSPVGLVWGSRVCS